MKILIATPYFFPKLGGLENYARFTAQGLSAAGCEVVVVCGDENVSQPVRDELDGYTVWRLPVWKVISNTPVNPAWPWMLRRIIRAEAPDVINAHAPVVFMVDMVTLVAGRVPVVVTWHAATLFKPGSFVMDILIKSYLAVRFMTLGRAKAVISVSSYVKQTLGRWSAKTTVVSNAVPAVAQARTQPGMGLVFVNNLEPAHSWKGLDLILDSLALLKQNRGLTVPLTVVGGGSDRPRYEARVAELGLAESVQFAGPIFGAERDGMIRQAAALVLYSTTANDAFPTVMLEAWAQGAAVIAAAIGPMPSLVHDGVTGVLVEPNNAEALAEAIQSLASNPDRMQVMGEAGRQLVAREYLWPRQVARTKTLFEALA